MGRIRTRSGTLDRKSRFCFAGSCGSESVTHQTTWEDYCSDVVTSYGADHPLTIHHYDGRGYAPATCIVNTGIYSGSYVKNSTQNSYGALTTHLATKTLKTVDWVEVAARTNPNRPDLNPLTLAQDLYDLPRMLKDIPRLARSRPGDLSVRDLANQNLAVQFGWIPLISDVKKLLDTQGRVNKRFNELRKLYNNGGTKKRIKVDEDHVESLYSSNLFMDSCGSDSLYMRVSKFTSKSRWATARWKLQAVPKEDRSFDRLHSLAWRTANGLTFSGIVGGVWDIIPWSWLVDWFTSASDIVAAYENTIPVKLESCCQMTQTSTQTSFTRSPSSDPSWTGGGGVGFFTTKEREVLSGSLFSASLPNLGWKEVSILGSLFIQRFLR